MTASKSKRDRRGPRRVTPDSLRNVALFYLQRYASSAENLRQVLMRRVEASARIHDTDRDEGAAAVADIVRRFTASGLLDDARYAQAQTASLARRGRSSRLIRATLTDKGVAAGLIDDALAALAEEQGDPDLAAAMALARRRRLGPYRDAAARAERRDRDLAALARGGFSFAVARRVIDAASPEALEAELAEGQV
ncbi:MAG: regulatory protein RecX [Inquilinaceae bacterium]